MVSLLLISAMVLVYCTIVTANPASNAWFMKEMQELVEAKEQMDELIDEREPIAEEYGIKSTGSEGKLRFSEANVMNELIEAMAIPSPQTCASSPGLHCDYKTIVEITKIVNVFCNTIQDVLKEKGLGARNNPATSCKAIKELNPNAASGTYYIYGNSGVVQVYCDMGNNVCGGESGGWMRIGGLDMNQSGESCPSPSEKVKGRRLCEATIGSSGGCSNPATFDTHGIRYSRVCGRIRAYQRGSTDGFASPIKEKKGVRGVSIDGAYVDGISLTHGRSPRTHIWTFASALNDKTSGFTFAQCPCMRDFTKESREPRVPIFVGTHLSCNTANPGENIPSGHVGFLKYALWDGKGCSLRNDCCNKEGLPWFTRVLGSETCDDVEMRVCSDEGTENENVLLEQVEFYVQ